MCSDFALFALRVQKDLLQLPRAEPEQVWKDLKKVTTVLETRDLILASGATKPNIVIEPGLTLIHMDRESSATVFAMTLAGRMKPRSGEVSLICEPEDEDSDPVIHTTQSALHQLVALAGVIQVDQLERAVPLQSVIREQIIWASPWYRRVPRDVTQIETFRNFAAVVGLDTERIDLKHTTVGDLDPGDRFRLRVVLALLARPEARLLVIDDIDQVRSLRIRDELLENFHQLANYIPVVVTSANPDTKEISDQVISMVHKEETAA